LEEYAAYLNLYEEIPFITKNKEIVEKTNMLTQQHLSLLGDE
jgi:hypothetical protein